VKSRESLVMCSEIPEDPFIGAPFSMPGKNSIETYYVRNLNFMALEENY